MQKKSFIDSIRIANPCTENWDEMAGNDRVRFCSHCAKDVNNLSEMTRKDAARLVRKSGGRLCVKYRTDPKTNAPVFADRVTAFARHGVAAGVLGASLLAAGAYAQGEISQPELVQIERVEKTGDPSAKISGYVTDPNGAGIPYALVSITNEETLLSQVQNASAEGFYEFKDLTAGKYKIHFEGGGFAAKDVEGVYVSDASEIRYDGRLSLLSMVETVEVKGSEPQEYVFVGIVSVTSFESSNELVSAVLDEDFDNVKARIIMRARVNVRDKTREGMSPLHAAVETGNLEIAEYLLSHGAKTNIRDYEKRTPLMMLDENAKPEMFELLVRYGAKTKLLDKEKNNVLHHVVASYVAPELIRQLSSYGVPVNGVNKEGKTPLMIAVENGMTDAVKVLSENGADVNIRARDGRTALDMIPGSEETIKSILETYGAVTGVQ